MRRNGLQTSSQFSQRTQGENITEFLAYILKFAERADLGPFTKHKIIQAPDHIALQQNSQAFNKSIKHRTCKSDFDEACCTSLENAVGESPRKVNERAAKGLFSGRGILDRQPPFATGEHKSLQGRKMFPVTELEFP